MTESTIVMTGATAGLGAHAARILAQHPDTHLIVGARGSGREVPGAQVKPLDLASLDSVRQFAETVGRELGDTPIRVLILNAGLQFRDTDHRTVDGFETTFAVNHLAHYLLARLLLPRIADGGVWSSRRATRMIPPSFRSARARWTQRASRIPNPPGPSRVCGPTRHQNCAIC
ncbi:Probable dehydrogenase/reductase [Mycobacteroides abscessus subsp. bolletii]|nr:Probable dehydrogenase/reductase [Mycobacteroides abscessus subsp. bolletii]SKH44981.1 Probable dehydrogenase/reductase [Mycobacteroides abscessus subsp. bolletii]